MKLGAMTLNMTLLLVLLPTWVFAAIPPQKKLAQPKLMAGTGAVYGGVAGDGFSLLSARHLMSKSQKTERIALQIGDRSGRQIKGLPGYYHAELKQNRLVIDFAQMPTTRVDALMLQKTLKRSKAVVSSQMITDPSDGSLSIILNLKPQTQARVYQYAGKKTSSAIVVDLIAAKR